MQTGVRALRPRAFARPALAGAAVILCLGLAACDNAPSASPARSHASGEGADRRLADAVPDGGESRAPASYRTAGSAGEPSTPRPRQEEVPLFHGRPMWAANKNHTAQENADYHYKRDGEALGATSEEDFLSKVHAFVDEPPEGAQTLTRANGDRLIYDARSNLFAVVDKDGAPRTLFKPRDGAAYWDQQKQSLANGENAARSSRRSAGRPQGDDNG